MIQDVYKIVTEKIRDDPKIKKQIVNIKPHIDNFINKEKEEILSKFEEEIDEPSPAKFALSVHIMELYALVMDTYALGRMFKDFDTRKNPSHPKQADICIVYAGDAHANNYRKFLTEEMGFKTIIDNNKPNYQSPNFTLKFSKEDREKSILFN